MVGNPWFSISSSEEEEQEQQYEQEKGTSQRHNSKSALRSC
jgi:hypothetical protein